MIYVEDASDTVEQMLDQLTDKQRFVIERSWGIPPQDRVYSYREIAEMMGVSHAAVYRIYSRAMVKMRGFTVE